MRATYGPANHSWDQIAGGLQEFIRVCEEDRAMWPSGNLPRLARHVVVHAHHLLRMLPMLQYQPEVRGLEKYLQHYVLVLVIPEAAQAVRVSYEVTDPYFHIHIEGYSGEPFYWRIMERDLREAAAIVLDTITRVREGLPFPNAVQVPFAYPRTGGGG